MKSSYRLKSGERPGGDAGPGGLYDGKYTPDYEFVAGSGDLDECNGRHGVTAEFPAGTYYYVITDQFPFIGRKYRGTPDASFRHGPPGGPGGPGGPGRFGPPPGFPPQRSQFPPSAENLKRIGKLDVRRNTVIALPCGAKAPRPHRLERRAIEHEVPATLPNAGTGHTALGIHRHEQQNHAFQSLRAGPLWIRWFVA